MSSLWALSAFRTFVRLFFFSHAQKAEAVDANVNFCDNENIFDDKKDIYLPIKLVGKRGGRRGKSNVDDNEST